MQEFFVYSEYISCFHSRFSCYLQFLPSATAILKFWGLYFLKSRTLAIGRSKETMARVFGLGIPRGGSKLPMKSDIWLNVMNCVACGSNLKQLHYEVIPFAGNGWCAGLFHMMSVFELYCKTSGSGDQRMNMRWDCELITSPFTSIRTHFMKK